MTSFDPGEADAFPLPLAHQYLVFARFTVPQRRPRSVLASWSGQPSRSPGMWVKP